MLTNRMTIFLHFVFYGKNHLSCSFHDYSRIIYWFIVFIHEQDYHKGMLINRMTIFLHFVFYGTNHILWFSRL